MEDFIDIPEEMNIFNCVLVQYNINVELREIGNQLYNVLLVTIKWRR